LLDALVKLLDAPVKLLLALMKLLDAQVKLVRGGLLLDNSRDFPDRSAFFLPVARPCMLLRSLSVQRLQALDPERVATELPSIASGMAASLQALLLAIHHNVCIHNDTPCSQES
jgi:hypothetical protein